MEPIITAAVITSSATLAQPLVKEMLGPLAAWIGEELKNRSEREIINWTTVSELCLQKVQNSGKRSGAIPPRILKQVFENAPLCDDPIAQQYYAGVLAASMTDSPRDDREIAISALLNRLSNYQLRAHFLIHKAFCEVLSRIPFTPDWLSTIKEISVYISLDDFIIAMEINHYDEEINNYPSLFAHILWGLAREQLIEQNWLYGNSAVLNLNVQDGIIVTPTYLGLDLILAAEGLSKNSPEVLFSPGIQIETLPDMKFSKFSRLHRRNETNGSSS